MRTLDIEFEGQQHPQPPLNNGFRPHGGYRGTNRYPLSQYTFNKSVEDRRRLKDDLDRLFGSDSLESLPSPFYAIDASKESNHSGESPLFEHRLLAPSRLEQKMNTEEYVKEYLPSRKKTSRPNSGVQYYRPDSPHQYMPATSANQEDPSVKYGRPTRTTLLRARNRCNSAPVNMYKMRKEVQKQYEQKIENRRPKTASVTVKDLLNSSVTGGESIHSFLIGARYNRAHCLDSKSVMEHGVYMPRGNPLGCFITRDRLREEEEEEDLPATPPVVVIQRYVRARHPLARHKLCLYGSDMDLYLESLLSNSDNEEEPPSPKHKQAWTASQSDRKKKVTKHDITLQHYINKDDGLNVKGTNVEDTKLQSKKPFTRPNSSRINYSRSSRAQSARLPSQTSARGPKPFVLIQGKSLPRGTKSLELTGTMTRKSNSQDSATNSSLNGSTNRIASHQRVKSGKTRGNHGGIVNGVSHSNETHDWEHENGVASPVSSVHFRPKSSRVGSARQAAHGQSVNNNMVNMPQVGERNNTPVRNEIEETFNLNQEESQLDDRISTSIENGAPSEIKEDITATESSMGIKAEEESSEINSKEGDQHERDVKVEKGEVLDMDNSEHVVKLEVTNDNQLGAKRTSRVRFADEVEEIEGSTELRDTGKAESHVGQGDNAVFFITEEREENGQETALKEEETAQRNAQIKEKNIEIEEISAQKEGINTQNEEKNAENVEANVQTKEGSTHSGEKNTQKMGKNAESDRDRVDTPAVYIQDNEENQVEITQVNKDNETDDIVVKDKNVDGPGLEDGYKETLTAFTAVQEDLDINSVKTGDDKEENPDTVD